MPIPVDVTATVLANHRLSDTDNILELQAPEIARHRRPGQFVMVKRAIGREPLLRRPFSVFEVIRDSDGTVTGLSIIGALTRSSKLDFFARFWRHVALIFEFHVVLIFYSEIRF